MNSLIEPDGFLLSKIDDKIMDFLYPLMPALW